MSAYQKQIQTELTRQGASFMNVIQEMEAEIVRMREKKLSDELIDKKDFQVETLVTYFNTADDLVQYFRLALANARMENHFLTEMLCKKISIEELAQYKPSAKMIIQKADLEDLPQTLSELNG